MSEQGIDRRESLKIVGASALAAGLTGCIHHIHTHHHSSGASAPAPDFQVEVDLGSATASIAIRMPRAEFEKLMSVLNDAQVMAPICAVVDPSPLGAALQGSTYCARCKDQDGEIRYSHQFKAKNWISAKVKAFWYCKGSFVLSRGTCGTAYGRVMEH